MNTVANQIAKILSLQNPAAPVTTHALAELGNGSMQAGVRRIVKYFSEESAANLRAGRVQGAVAGVLITVAVGGGAAYLYHSNKSAEHEKEGKEILETLEKKAIDDDCIQAHDCKC